MERILGPMFFRAIEIAFASYMVPALLVPPAWAAAWVLRRRLLAKQPLAEVEGHSKLLLGIFSVWLALFVAVLAGVPLYRGGSLAVAGCWAVYAVTNFLLAWFLLRFISRYGLIAAGKTADRVFLRFIAIVAAQPLMTAAAFAVLNNVMGLAWNAQVPELPAIQEGI